MRILPTILVGGLTFVASCTAPARLSKRHATYEIEQVPSTNAIAELSAFVLPRPVATASTKLTEMSDRGQAAFIEALAAKSKDANSLTAALARPLAIGGKASTDRTRVSRRVVFSIEKLQTLPADRLSRAVIHLRLPAGAKFVSWDKFTTKHETIDLTKMTSTTERSASFGADFVAPKFAELSGVELDLGGKQTLVEESQLRQRYIVSSGRLSQGEAVLVQEGVSGIDLTGNVTLDVTFELPTLGGRTLTSFQGLFKPDGTPQDADKVKLSRPFYEVPAKGDVMATAHLEYVVRTVGECAETIEEGDDEVLAKAGSTVPITFPIATEETLRFEAFQLRLGNGELVHFRSAPGLAEEVVLFPTWESARDLQLYLAHQAGAGAANLERLARGTLVLSDGSAIDSTMLAGADIVRTTLN